MEANDNQNEFNFFSPFYSLTIFGWIFSLLALILAIMLRFKVRTISMMLMVRTARASVLPKALHVSTTVEPSMVDSLKISMSHVQHVPNLLPVERSNLRGTANTQQLRRQNFRSHWTSPVELREDGLIYCRLSQVWRLRINFNQCGMCYIGLN